MYQRSFVTLLSLIVVSQLSIGVAAAPAIGVALTQGSFRVDDSRVTGNSTLFEGTTVETGETASQLRLEDGVQMRLASGSRGTIFRDRMILERGVGQLENAQDFTIEAKGIQVLSAAPNSAARVALKEHNLIQVAALRGNFRVRTSGGITLATLAAGRALEFDAEQAGASAPWTLTGCMQKREGHYVLTDETAGVTVELRGAGLESSVGHKVSITGMVVPSVKAEAGASQVIQVSTVKQIAERCSSQAAAAAAAGGAAAAGMSVGTKAVIAGVVVAAAGTGTAVGLTSSEDPKTISQ